jgi:hypothetical protein
MASGAACLVNFLIQFMLLEVGRMVEDQAREDHAHKDCAREDCAKESGKQKTMEKSSKEGTPLPPLPLPEGEEEVEGSSTRPRGPGTALTPGPSPRSSPR